MHLIIHTDIKVVVLTNMHMKQRKGKKKHSDRMQPMIQILRPKPFIQRAKTVFNTQLES